MRNCTKHCSIRKATVIEDCRSSLFVLGGRRQERKKSLSKGLYYYSLGGKAGQDKQIRTDVSPQFQWSLGRGLVSKSMAQNTVPRDRDR